MRAVLAQTRVELTLTLRRGESVLLALGIPVLLLVFFSTVDVGFIEHGRRVDFVAPGVLALAVMSTAMVGLGIATGFERQYGVLKRLGATPLGRPALLAAKTLAEKPNVVAEVREMILRTNPADAAAAQGGMAARRDYSIDLPGISVPTLIIVGREDTVRPVSDAEFMHRGIRDSRLEIIGDAAHMTNMKQPEAFNEALIEFLRLIH